MSGQVRQWGAAAILNLFTNNVTIGSSAPGSPVAGQVWIDTAVPNIQVWNGSAWVVKSGTLYLALLIADPNFTGPSGGDSVNISDLVEDPTPGYSRQSITFAEATDAVPAVTTNTNTITFGPYTANQSQPVGWAALVTASTGTTGLLLYTWELDTPQQVQVSEPIIVPPSTLELDQQ